MTKTDLSSLPSTPAGANDVRGSELRSIVGFGSECLPAPGEQIPLDAKCADCGETSDDYGRFRNAEPHEEADADGQVYECGYCGCMHIIPPVPNISDEPRS